MMLRVLSLTLAMGVLAASGALGQSSPRLDAEAEVRAYALLEARAPEWLVARALTRPYTPQRPGPRDIAAAGGLEAGGGLIDWVTRFGTGQRSQIDNADAIVQDAEGNVYIVAGSEYPGTSFDIVTVRYSPGGQEEWAARYNGPADGLDLPTAVAVAPDGAVYVAGTTMTSGGLLDYVLLRYEPDGTLAWLRRYGGPVGGFDVPTALQVGADGRVYLTGFSQRSEWAGDFGIATLQVAPDGELLWESRFDEALSEAYAIAVYEDGGVVVGGFAFQHLLGEEELEQCRIAIRYDAAGRREWASCHREPGDEGGRITHLGISGDGSVVAVGHTHREGEELVQVAVLDAQGALQWEDVYRPGGGRADLVAGLHVEEDGGFYVCGYGQLVYSEWLFLRYAASGARAWAVTEPLGGARMSGCTFPGDGTFYAVGYAHNGTTSEALAARYEASDGSKRWAAVYRGPENDDTQLFALTHDRRGGLLAAGRLYRRATDYDALTLAYSPEGELAWASFFEGPGEANDVARASFMDAAGNVYLTGTSQPQRHGEDIITAKITPSGDVAWYALDSESTNGWANAVAADAEGNVVVVGGGVELDDPDRAKMVALKYDAQGGKVWRVTYPLRGWGAAEAVALEPGGGAVLAGTGFIVIGLGADGTLLWTDQGMEGEARFVFHHGDGEWSVVGSSAHAIVAVRYRADGTRRWVYEHAGALTATHAAEPSPEGGLLITGVLRHGFDDPDWITIKVTREGALAWQRRYDGPTGGEDEPHALSVDSEGNVYVVGNSRDRFGEIGPRHFVLVKYDAEGRTRWEHQDEAVVKDWYAMTPWDRFYMTPRPEGGVYVASAVPVGFASSDFLLVGFSPEGERDWEARYASRNGYYDTPVGVHAGEGGTVTIAAASGARSDYLGTWYRSVLTAMRFRPVANRAPVITSTPASAVMGDLFTYQVEATDPDGDRLQYELAYAYAWLDMDPERGVLFGWPWERDDVDSYTTPVVLYVSDGRGGVAYQRFKLHVGQATSADREESDPFRDALHSVFPNPVREEGTIVYELASAGHVRLKLFNVLGQEVRRLEDGLRGAGEHSVRWRPAVPAGVYVLRLEVGTFAVTRRVVVL